MTSALYPCLQQIDLARTEALVADTQIPEVDPEVVGRDVRLLIAVYGDRVDVVSVCVRVDLAGNSSDNVILVGHPWQAKVLTERRRWYGSLAIAMV